MKRGDLVSVSFPGDYGKPRPAVVIQADIFSYLQSVTVLPLASDPIDAKDVRIPVLPTPQNGLRQKSFIMIEKIGTLPRTKTSEPFGRIADDEMVQVNRALALFLGFV
jgi:mRNA interferase MazF